MNIFETLPQFVSSTTIQRDCRALVDILSRSLAIIRASIASLEQNISAPNISNITVANTPYTALSGDYLIDVDASGGAVTIYLPFYVNSKREISICKKDSSGNAVTVNGNSKSINGSATSSIGTQYMMKTYIYTGTEWRIKG